LRVNCINPTNVVKVELTKVKEDKYELMSLNHTTYTTRVKIDYLDLPKI